MHARLLVAVASLAAALLVTPPAEARINPQNAGLQVALRAWGHYFGPIDGIAGPMTARAVRSFQRRHGLAVDGIPGPRTRRAMGRLGRPLYGRRLIRRGMVGWDVSVLQFLLTRRGAPTGIIDGYFGAETSRALRRFQRRTDLAVDSIAGPRTRRALATVRVGRPARPRSVRGLLNHWAGLYGVNARLVRALAWVESGFQPHVVSRAGAFGVMQVTPATWEFVEDVLVGREIKRTTSGNVQVGVAYFHWLLHEFRMRVRRALAAYNQGPASVRRRGVYRETRRFVATVLAVVGDV